MKSVAARAFRMSASSRCVMTVTPVIRTSASASSNGAYMLAVHGSSVLGKRDARSPSATTRLDRTLGGSDLGDKGGEQKVNTHQQKFTF